MPRPPVGFIADPRFGLVPPSRRDGELGGLTRAREDPGFGYPVSRFPWLLSPVAETVESMPKESIGLAIGR